MDYFHDYSPTFDIESIDLGSPCFATRRFEELPHTPYPAETTWLSNVLDLDFVDTNDSESDSDDDDSDDSDSDEDVSDDSDSDEDVSDEDVSDDGEPDDNASKEDIEASERVLHEGSEADCEGLRMYLEETLSDDVNDVTLSNYEDSHVEGYDYADRRDRVDHRSETDEEFSNLDSSDFDNLSAEYLMEVMEYCTSHSPQG